MTDPTRAAYESALHKLNELSGRLAIGRENDDYLHRLANAAQNVAIAAREVYAEAREKDLLCSRKSFSRAWAGESMARSKHASLPDGYALEAREDGDVYKRQVYERRDVNKQGVCPNGTRLIIVFPALSHQTIRCRKNLVC